MEAKSEALMHSLHNGYNEALFPYSHSKSNVLEEYRDQNGLRRYRLKDGATDKGIQDLIRKKVDIDYGIGAPGGDVSNVEVFKPEFDNLKDIDTSSWECP